MKILYISSWYPSRILPTNGDFIVRHAESSALNNDVCFLHIAYDQSLSRKKNYDFQTHQKNNVIHYILYFGLSNFPVLRKLRKTFKYFKGYYYGYKLIKNKYGKYDIIHANIIYPTSLYALFLKFLFRIPYVLSEHWTGYHTNNISKVQIWLSRLGTKHSSFILPVSNDLKKALIKKRFNSEYIIVPNVVDTSLFYPVKTVKKYTKTKILHISSFKDEHKNITGILRTMIDINKKRNDLELTMISSQKTDYAKKYAEERGILNKAVKIYEFKEQNEIAEIMRESDFFVLFSNVENLPCVIVESLASGLPVISTDVGGISEHITKERGILIKPKDELALFNAIIEMMNNIKFYDKNKLYNYAVENFSKESIGSKLTEIYNKVIKFH